MRVFLTIVSFIFMSTFFIACTSMSNHNDLQISVDNKDGESEIPTNSKKESPKPNANKASPPHIWKWADSAKKR